MTQPSLRLMSASEIRDRVQSFLQSVDDEPNYMPGEDLPIPLAYEVVLSEMWPAAEVLPKAEIQQLANSIDNRGGRFRCYCMRMAALALRTSSPHPALWGLCALALASSEMDSYDVRRYLTLPCDALNRLGFNHHDYLLRAAVFAHPEVTVFTQYQHDPTFPGEIGAQGFVLGNAECGQVYMFEEYE